MEHARHPVDPLVRRDAAAEGSGHPEGHHEGDVRAWATAATPSPACRKRAEGHREARPAGRRRSASDHLGGAGAEPQEQHLSAADLPPATRCAGSRTRVQPLAPVGRADRQADLRDRRTTTRSCTCSPRSSASPTRCSRTSRSRTTVPVGRGHPARDQSRRLVDRLLRPVARAPQVAHGATRQDFDLRHADGRRPARSKRRLLRSAVAVLGHAGVQASRHAAPLQHQPLGEGRRRHVPRPLRRGARGEAARRHRRARSACSATVPTPRIRRSRTAIRSSRSAC